MSKRISLDQNSVWKRATIGFLPETSEDEDDVRKGLRTIMAVADAIPGLTKAEKVEAVRQLFELGYAQTVETDDGLALEILFPDPDATYTQPNA